MAFANFRDAVPAALHSVSPVCELTGLVRVALLTPDGVQRFVVNLVHAEGLLAGLQFSVDRYRSGTNSQSPSS